MGLIAGHSHDAPETAKVEEVKVGAVPVVTPIEEVKTEVPTTTVPPLVRDTSSRTEH